MKTIREVELEEKCKKLEKEVEKANTRRFEAFQKIMNENSNLKTALDESQEVVISYKEENEKLKNKIDELHEDLKTLWIVLWNMDTEMTGYQNEIYDKYYDEFHKE